MFSKVFEKCEEHSVSKIKVSKKWEWVLKKNEEFVLEYKLDEEDKIVEVYCLLQKKREVYIGNEGAKTHLVCEIIM